MNQFEEMKTLLPELAFQMIFDIGANIGQSSEAYRRAFPGAIIYAFEPVQSTFAKMVARFADDRNVHCFQLAFGSEQAVATIEVGETSVKNKIVSTKAPNRRTEDVRVETGDNFCATQRIERINFLKIDTEGYDLNVCKGFRAMLAATKVDVVQVEAGLHPQNSLHVPFQAFKAYLEPLGYSILRIYDQAGTPAARRCNIVFVSEAEVLRNPRGKRTRAGKHNWL